MFIVGILSWWYTTGWRQQFTGLQTRLASTVDYFSIDLLLRTFFAPFRQISAGKVTGPLGIQIHAFFDRLVSRMIGAMVRLVVIIIGAITIIISAVIGAVMASVWAVVPFLPIVGLIVALSGWVPWHL
ncbi:MAG: hypothetical protein ACHQTE_01435 [Candidatus Saccharimonadales bacterium]